VRTYYGSPTGREITLGYWSGGDLVGGPNFFDTHTHVWSAEAVVDTVVLAIHAHDFKKLATTVPSISALVLDTLSFKMFWFSQLLQMMGTEPGIQRIAHLLLILCEVGGTPTAGGTVLKRPFTQEELGNMAGVTRQWVNKVLGEFRRRRLIRFDDHHAMVVDVAAVRSYLRQCQGAGDMAPAGNRTR
jgi:CRP-like cAMP-binding protein